MWRIDRWLRSRNLPTIVLAGLAVVVAALYAPSIAAPFQGDDFNWLRYLIFRFPALLDGREWDIFLTPFMEPGAWILFRPGFQLLFLMDYTAWGLNPFGYHLTNVVLHILTAFLVFVLGKQLTHNRLVAIVAGVLFAVMPIHVEAVAWFAARADGLSALWFLISLVFYVSYRERNRISFLIFSVVAFAMSLLAKEASVTLPVMLALYDWLYQRDRRTGIWNLFAPEIPAWLTLTSYLALRLFLLGSFSNYVGGQLLHANLGYFSSIYLTALTDPFLPDVMAGMQVALIALGVVALIAFRSRRAVFFGLIWLIVTILPSVSSLDGLLFDRFAYLPTVGLALVLATVLAQPSDRLVVWARAVVLGALILLVVAYSVALYNRNGEYTRSAEVTRLVTEQIHALHPTLPADARLYIKGL
ncbi:MAG: hypothetical protein KGJ80_07100, partial [Chloroflexota bacterium]|nr:hypothetical protein [Chloroflexota bacterium]